MKEVKLIYFVFCLLAVAGLLACGGGGGSGDSTFGSTQFTSIGTITGFGSVYVGETKFETKNADIYLDGELGSQDDLRIGMKVKVKGTYDDDDEMGDADTIEYDKELEGPISSIEEVNPDRKELMVMCKKVIVEKGETKFENTSFDDLAEYMFIEVSGYPDSSGAIRATYIEKIYDVYDPEEDEVEIEGVVENWNEEDMTFEIEGCVVYYSEDTEFDGLSPSELEDGLYVEVEGKFEVPNEIYAIEIELEDDDHKWNEGETVHIEGYIENVESKYEFEVKGYDYPVRVSMDTILENGSLDDIVEGNKVKVEGEIEDEYLWAEKIYFYLDYTEDFATALTKDGEGNVYVTGYSKGEFTDFDYMTVKYNPDGKKLWARRYNNTEYNGEDIATAIAVYGDRVCVTGYSKGDNTDFDYATVCYAEDDGEPIWIMRYDDYYSEDKAQAIAMDDSYVYVTGYSKGEDTDFDYATVWYDKFDPYNNQWIKRYDGGFYKEDKAQAIAVDETFVCVTGFSDSDDNDFDYATVCYEKQNGMIGMERVMRYEGYQEDKAQAIAMDDLYVHVTGYSKGDDTDFDYLTISYYKKPGEPMWGGLMRRYNSRFYKEDKAQAIAVDGTFVCVTGFSKSDDNDFDYATVCYDNEKEDEDPTWVMRYEGYQEDKAQAIAMNNSYVYVTGYSKGGETDFDYLTISYEKFSGDRKGLARYDGFYKEDKAQAIAVDGSSVWVTGYSDGDHSDFDYVTIKYSTEKLDEMWVARFDGYYDDDPYTMK